MRKHPRLRAVYCQSTRFGWPLAWRMVVRLKGKDQMFCMRETNSDLSFLREVDCDLAIEAFRQAGILTITQLVAVPDADRRRIATSLLQW